MAHPDRSRSPHRQESHASESSRSRIVELNVGGVHYTTSRATLCLRQDSMLAAMFAGNIPSDRDERGRAFIDRDGLMFRHVLNHLRGCTSLPASEFDLGLLCEEAAFYNLPDLEGLARNALVAVDPCELPEEFEWYHCDIDDDIEAQEIVELLQAHYVEDSDNIFRSKCSAAYLRWLCRSPESLSKGFLGIRLKKTGQLVAFVAAIKRSLRVQQQQLKVVEISFLCLHMEHRGQGLFRTLVQEITRCVNRQGIEHAVYRTGVHLRRKERRHLIGVGQWHHRPLNFKKLVDVEFAQVPDGMTEEEAINSYKLPDRLQVAGMRPMREEDVRQVYDLVAAHSKKFPLHFECDVREIAHHLLPQENLLYTLVREDKGCITDLCSFYSNPSTIINNDDHDILYAASMTSVIATGAPLSAVVLDALIYAQGLGFDVFNVDNSGDIGKVVGVEDLRFVAGDGTMHIYMHNWKCELLQPGQIFLCTPV